MYNIKIRLKGTKVEGLTKDSTNGLYWVKLVEYYGDLKWYSNPVLLSISEIEFI